MIQQETLALLQKTISAEFSEQRIELEKIVTGIEKQPTRSLDEQVRGTSLTPATHPRVPPKSVKRSLAPLVGSHSNTSDEWPRSSFDLTRDPDVGEDRVFSRLDLQDQRLELYNQGSSLSIVLSTPKDWTKTYLTMLMFLARGLCELFWSMLAIDPRLLALYVAIQTRIPTVPSLELSINDSIRLIDAFGQERRLQYATHRHFPVFKSFLTEDYRHTPSGLYIAQNHFRLLDAKASTPVLINEESWSSQVRPGMRVTLSVVLERLTAMDGNVCPGCGKRRAWSWMSHRYACSCGLMFYRNIDRNTCKTKTNTASRENPSQHNDYYQSKPEIPALGASSMLAVTLDAEQKRSDHLSNSPSSSATSSSHTRAQANGSAQSSTQRHDKSYPDFVDSDRRHITVFKNVILETAEKFQGLLAFHINPERTTDLPNFRRHRELYVNSTPYVINLLEWTDMRGPFGRHRTPTKANILLQVDELGNLWIRCETSYPQICVNGIPLWQTRTIRDGSSTPQRVKENDLIEVKDCKIVPRFVITPCRRPAIGPDDGSLLRLTLPLGPKLRRKFLFPTRFRRSRVYRSGHVHRGVDPPDPYADSDSD